MPVSLGRALAPSAIEGLPVRAGTPVEFSHAWLGKADRVRRQREDLRARGLLDGASVSELVRQGAALEGTLRIPVVAVRYADVAAPFPTSMLSDRLFGPVRGDTMTLAAYWREVSGGLLDVDGAVTSWVRLRRPADHYLSPAEYGWGQVGRMSEFWEQALERADAAIDFTRFDNDGPDGIPNSGDDDGHVDLVVLYYATGCGRDERAGGLWPHRGTMPPFRTDDAGADGRAIAITDYVVLPAQGPGGCDPAHVGVLAHETAHALGLPDLYDYDGSSRGIGSWGLMGTGSHARPHSPAHPGAWEKEQLGWVRVDWARAGESATVPAVADDPRVLRHDLADGSGRYLLMEYRSARGSDRYIPGHGLLVWGIDPERGALGQWNGDERHPAVTLLTRGPGGRLVAGDGTDASAPYPGRPAADATAPFFPAVLDILEGLDRAQVRVRPSGEPAWTARTLRLAAMADGAVLERTLGLENADAGGWVARARPGWLRLTRTERGVVLAADPAGLSPGVHTDSVELMDERTGAVLDRIEVVLDVVGPGQPSVVAAHIPWSWGLTVHDGGLVLPGVGSDPFGLRPRPRLLRVDETSTVAGTLARLPVEALYAPTTHGGDLYVIGRAHERNYVYRVRPNGEAAVVGPGLAGEPAYGLTVLPDGTVLVAGWTGRITRITPDGQANPWADVGQSIYQISAGPDGSVYAALLTGQVLEISPDGRLRRLETGFGSGRLVAVTVSPDGRVFAAERGGAGRIIELGDPVPRVVGRVLGGEFYGLAMDPFFLYGLDLGNGELIRIPIPPATAPPQPTIAAGS